MCTDLYLQWIAIKPVKHLVRKIYWLPTFLCFLHRNDWSKETPLHDFISYMIRKSGQTFIAWDKCFESCFIATTLCFTASHHLLHIPSALIPSVHHNVAHLERDILCYNMLSIGVSLIWHCNRDSWLYICTQAFQHFQCFCSDALMPINFINELEIEYNIKKEKKYILYAPTIGLLIV